MACSSTMATAKIEQKSAQATISGGTAVASAVEGWECAALTFMPLHSIFGTLIRRWMRWSMTTEAPNRLSTQGLSETQPASRRARAGPIDIDGIRGLL